LYLFSIFIGEDSFNINGIVGGESREKFGIIISCCRVQLAEHELRLWLAYHHASVKCPAIASTDGLDTVAV